MRLFIGLPLPESYQESLAQLQERLKRLVRIRVGWTKRGTWHLTLKFLGEVAEDRVAGLGAALGGLRWPAFSLQAGSAGFFPNPARPRVLWAGLARGAPECKTLAEAVELACMDLGFEPEERPFSAHLTIARIKDAGRESWREVLAAAAVWPWPEALMDRVVLWRSELKSEGPVYTALAEGRASGGGGESAGGGAVPGPPGA